MPTKPVVEAPSIAPGKLLEVCAQITEPDTLEQALVNGADRLFPNYQDEFRLAITELLRAREQAQQRLVAVAKRAVENVRKVRLTVKSRAWGDAAEEKARGDEDPKLKEGVHTELAQIKTTYEQEYAQVLADLRAVRTKIVDRFAALHLEMMCNARAIVEYDTGFELDEPEKTQ